MGAVAAVATTVVKTVATTVATVVKTVATTVATVVKTVATAVKNVYEEVAPVVKTYYKTALKTFRDVIGSNIVSAKCKKINYSAAYLSEYAKNSQDKVKQIRVRSCWLGHGGYSAVGSVITGTLTGMSLTHWWVQIETYSGDWYCAQLYPNGSCLELHSSLSAVNKCGLQSGGNDSNGNITTKKTYKPSNRTIGQVYNWVKNSNHVYDLMNHNCQDWAMQFFFWI